MKKNIGFSLLSLLLLAVVALAQDPAATPAENAPAAPAAAPAEASNPDVKLFLDNFGSLKEVSTKVQALQKEFAGATTERKDEIRKEGMTLSQSVMQMYQSLIPMALKAFPQSGGNVPELNQFMMDYVMLCLERDDYEIAYNTLSLMLKLRVHKEYPELLEMAGTASFMLNQFGVAQQCYKAAQSIHQFSQRGDRFAEQIPYYTEAWNAEKQIRDAEKQIDDLPRVLIRTTAGDIEVELFENEAPNTVANFISLVEKGFYDGLTFHRVLPGFMAQGGDPKGDGTGGPGYAIPCETDKPNARKHFRGTLSMAHAGKDTGGSQFFITFIPTKMLDGVHTAFGRVVRGMDTLAKIQRIDPERPYPGIVPTKIVEMKVLRKRDHAYAPKTLADPR